MDSPHSFVVDGNGMPARVYRGEHGSPSNNWGFQSRLSCLSFSDCPKVASEYALIPNHHALDGTTANAPRVIPSFVSISRPVIDQRDGDPFIDLPVFFDALGQKRAATIASRYSDWIEGTNNWLENFGDDFQSVGDLMAQNPDRIGDLYFNAYVAFDDHEIVRWLSDAGFDGAIHGGNGVGAGTTEYKVFFESQICSAIGY